MEEESDDAMRQMMGFSSFGGKPKKRQKLNTGGDILPTRSHATSSNSTPLGARTQNMGANTSVIPPNLLPRRKSVAAEASHQSKEAAHPVPDPNVNKLPTPLAAKEHDNDLTGKSAHVSIDGRRDSDEIPLLSQTDGPNESTNPIKHLTPTAPAFTPAPGLIPASLPPTPAYTKGDVRSDPDYAKLTPNRKSSAVYSQKDVRSQPIYDHAAVLAERQAQEAAAQHAYDNDIAYVGPSGIKMTRRELDEYAIGKKELQPDGSVVAVFFSPDMIEDPWTRM